MKSAFLILSGLVLMLPMHTSLASVSQVQIYGIVQRVAFEPNERDPKRIKIYGAFAFLYTNQDPTITSTDGPYSPHRGYLYFSLPGKNAEETKRLEATAKKEWDDLKKVAGTGEAITFGSWPSSYLGLDGNSRSESGFVAAPPYDGVLRVHSETEGSPRSIAYTMDTGITKIPNNGRFAALIAQLEKSLQR